MKFTYHRNEKDGIYNASIVVDNEYLTLSTQMGGADAMWTSRHSIGSAFQAAGQALGEPDVYRQGLLRPLNLPYDQEPLSFKLHGKRSPATIMGVIATRPDAIHSAFITYDDATEIGWHQHQHDKSWPTEQRFSMMQAQSERLLGQTAFYALFQSTASEQLRNNSDEIFEQIAVGDFWQPKQTERLMVAPQSIVLSNAA